jgi:hypothetical protein
VDELVSLDGSQLVACKRYDGARLTVEGNELDLEGRSLIVAVHHGANVAGGELVIWYVLR